MWNRLKKSKDFPGGSDGKVSAYNAGDLGSIPGLGRFPGEGNGNPLQYSCLENPMDGGTWWATVRGVTKSQTRLSDFTFTFTLRGYVQRTLILILFPPLRFPGSSDGKASVYNAETWVRSLDREDPLEKGMATHSTIHAWKIPWTVTLLI